MFSWSLTGAISDGLTMGTPGSAQLVEWAESFGTAQRCWGSLMKDWQLQQQSEGEKQEELVEKIPPDFYPASDSWELHGCGIQRHVLHFTSSGPLLPSFPAITAL